MVKIAIIGFGRMGLSHLSILRGLLGDNPHSVTIFDPSITSRVLAKLILPDARVRKGYNLSKLRRFDYVLFTTPPFQRNEELALAEQLDCKVFIEKPVVGKLPRNGMSGYVLQHAPLIETLRFELLDRSVQEIHCTVRTPLDFTETKGWRATQFGTIISEFLGHAVTLSLAPLAEINFSNDSDELAVEAQGRNSVNIRFPLSGDIKMCVTLTGNCSSVRKTAYRAVYFDTENNEISHNLYEIRNGSATIADIASLGVNTPYYVRGFEFSNQMAHFYRVGEDVLDRQTINDIELLISRVQERAL